jgi:hypothetical protein
VPRASSASTHRRRSRWTWTFGMTNTKRLLTAGWCALALLGVTPAEAQLTLGTLGVGGGVAENGGDGGGGGLLLDGLPQALGAYSTRKLHTAYAGSAIRVIRTSDSTQQDIGFVGSPPVLDTVSLGAFCAGTICTVTKWYDQSGSGNDCSQTSNLPTIYTGGAVTTLNGKPALLWPGGTSGQLGCPYSSSPTNARFYNAVVKSTDFSQAQYVFGSTINNTGLLLGIDDTSGGQRLIAPGAAVIGAATNPVSTSTGNVLEAYYDASTGSYSFYLDGTANGSGTNLQKALAGGNVGLCGYQFGQTCKGQDGEQIIYDTPGALSSSDRGKIEANQKAYWGTP